jgi:hypothetical protein
MKRFYRAGAIVLAVASISVGCRSTSSTFMSRFDNDRVAGNSNGERGLHENAKPFKGIPVTMKVPTHLDVKISETVYLDPATLKMIPTERRNLVATTEIIKSDKIFAVDPKKAAAGNTKYSFKLKDGYYTQVKQHVEDKTINDVNTALGQLLPLLATKSAPTGKGTNRFFEGDSLGSPVPKERVVALKRFDLNSVNVEDQVKQFVDHHMNDCNSCCENTTLVQ